MSAFHRFFMPLVVMVLALVAACAAPTATPAPTQAPAASPTTGTSVPSRPGALRIGVLPITDVVPFYIADQEGYFKQQGLTVDLVPASSAAERDQLMATQQIDGELNDLVSTAIFNAQSSRLKIVRTARHGFPNAPEYWILAPKDGPVKTAQDLKGKEIAISQNSVIQYLTERLLQFEGLASSDIKTTNVPQIPTRMQLLSQGQVAAATLPDPFASLAILQGARVIADDSKHPEVGMSVISFRSDVVAQRADDVRKFLAAYDRAIQDIRTRPDQFRNLLIDKGRVPDPLKDKYQFPPFPDPAVPTQAEWEDVVKWTMEHNLIKAPVTYESSVATDFVK